MSRQDYARAREGFPWCLCQAAIGIPSDMRSRCSTLKESIPVLLCPSVPLLLCPSAPLPKLCVWSLGTVLLSLPHDEAVL